MLKQGKMIEVNGPWLIMSGGSIADFPWDTSNMDPTQKKNVLAPTHAHTHIPNRNMLENTIFYLIRDDYIYNLYICLFIQQYLYSNMYQTR